MPGLVVHTDGHWQRSDGGAGYAVGMCLKKRGKEWQLNGQTRWQV